MQTHIRNGLVFLGMCVSAGLALAIASLPEQKAPSPPAFDHQDEIAPEPSPEVAPVREEPNADTLAAAISMLGDAPSDELQETPLQLMMTHSDHQTLENGGELLAVSGRVINPTDEPQTVPSIRAELHSSAGQLVYSWIIPPPARTLPPGESVSFNSAELNVPPGGDELTVTLGPPSE